MVWKKGGMEGNWHPSLSKPTMENCWFLTNVSAYHRPYLNTQHDTDIHTSYHNSQQHNTIQHTDRSSCPLTHPLLYPPLLSTSVHVQSSSSLCRVSADLRCSLAGNTGTQWPRGQHTRLEQWHVHDCLQTCIVHTHFWLSGITLDAVQTY